MILKRPQHRAELTPLLHRQIVNKLLGNQNEIRQQIARRPRVAGSISLIPIRLQHATEGAVQPHGPAIARVRLIWPAFPSSCRVDPPPGQSGGFRTARLEAYSRLRGRRNRLLDFRDSLSSTDSAVPIRW